MLDQGGPASVAFPAVFATVGPLSGVHPFMLAEVRAVAETLPTVCAFVRPLARVDFDMPAQLGLAGPPLATVGAFVGRGLGWLSEVNTQAALSHTFGGRLLGEVLRDPLLAGAPV